MDVDSKNNLQDSIQDYELQAVPSNERKHWWFIAIIWVAIGIDISGLFLGAFLSEGMTLFDSMIAVFIGSSLLAVLAALCANVGFSSGLSTVLICSNVFGRIGGKLVGFVTGVSLVGWYAFQLDFFTVVTTSALESIDIEISRFIVLIFGSLLMSLTALWGVRALGKLSMISVPILISIIGYALYTVMTSDSTIQDVVSEPIGFGVAISYVVSIWILGAVNAPDVARYARQRKDAILGAGLGFLIGNSFIVVVALVLTKFVGNDDLVAVLFSLGMGLSAILVLVLAQWTTNTMNLIGGALDLAVTFPTAKRWVLVGVISVVGTVLAIDGMVDRFGVFLSFLGTVVSPIAGVYLVDYYLINRKKELSVERGQIISIHYPAIIAWCIGAITCFITSYDFLNLIQISSISVLDGTVAAALSYLIISKFSSIASLTSKVA
ncbi:cytosine permease [Vibrio algarum]|uniref:Cytosine permease n=1 Tax=Vibrio algarum TaxID=3020714 RepID=A0ABT4YM34_9VIBR|nr:cytosine permease [Vibrio sp. KJ40-1]MDB1122596.1 cytosine permease [Vibrio sp. KJ40-1]